MDPVQNSFAPTASRLRTEGGVIRETVTVCLERLRKGKTAKSVIMVGRRGVGKTELLAQTRKDAENSGIQIVGIDLPDVRSLPALLAPQLRLVLLRLNEIEPAKDFAVRGLRALAGFATKLKFTYNDIEVSLDYDPEPGLADNGDLETDLTALLEQVGHAAQKAATVLAIFIDELQQLGDKELAVLICALHRCAQDGLPVMVIGAGLPQLRGKLAEVKSYAERLFEFSELLP